MSSTLPVESPCTGVCAIDPASGWCFGCARSIDEIVRWGSTDEGDRRAVIAALPERTAALAGRKPG